MSNTRNNPGTPRRGREFKPREPYTHRLRKILEEYPDGSQVLREILQNSDDAQSTEQIFILDHNTYKSNNLLEPDLNGYQRTNLKLDRYQGPALLAKNDTIFEERDFQSLLKLADSEKQDQFDKIGVMGVGFNSIYHITDSPSFITGDKYVILDPHERYFNGGVEFDFNQELAEEYPDQFSPFSIPCDKSFNGTIFRYPLRTNEDSIDSEISDKVYKPEEILDMFHKFYEKESINCLLFLKYIERIHFYELREGATELELIYTIQLENVDDNIRQQRRLIVEKIVPLMNLLKSKKLSGDNQLETSYVASFSQQQKGSPKETSSWLILNYLDDLLKAEAYFYEKFGRYIGDYKFIPNVGLAVPLDNLNVTGRLFCFLPLPISMPFLVSVHGYFAVSTNRRSLWSAADNEDLAADALARLKVTWNEYLFEKVLPKAWVKFLRELPCKVSNIHSDDLYRFWPLVKESTSGSTSSINSFCKDLLQNVVENLDVEDRIFKGPSSSNAIGTVSKVSADAYDASSFKESEFHWLSLSNGYLEDEKLLSPDLSEIIGNIGFPVITVFFYITNALKNSRHAKSLHFFSPSIIRTYLKCNNDRWKEGAISRKEVLHLFDYILKDKKFDELEGFKMIPLADGTLGTLTQSSNSNVYVYIGPDDDIMNNKNDECNNFKDQLSKYIDKSIENYGLYHSLYGHAKSGWNLNIKILNEFAVADMIKFSLNYAENEKDSEEMQISNRCEWIYKLWNNLIYRNWDLTKFEDIHLIPTNRSTLRKLKTPRKIFSSQTSKNISINSLIPIFEKFGAVFADKEFDVGQISEWNKVSSYIIKPDDIISVLDSFQADSSYPENLRKKLQILEASSLVEHLSNYLRLANRYYLVQECIDVIKHLPVFTEIDHDSPIPLLPGNRSWYLLPREEENSYGKIIYPSDKGGFLNTSTQNFCYILEDIIKIPRLDINVYWRDYVIPFLGSQSSRDIDIVVDKLFDRLPNLLNKNANLKGLLGKVSFVPAGTLQMSQLQKTPTNISLAKPTELFDPEESSVTDLFFDDEEVFPAGKYGISQSWVFSNKFLSNLRLLGIKPILNPDDIISRIDTIVTRGKSSSANVDLIRFNALKLFKYIDEKWDGLAFNDSQASLKAILENEWIPTVDTYGNRIFSKPQDCYSQKYKNLVSLVTPILEYTAKNDNFLKHLKWNTYPEVKTVLKQLELCRDGVTKKKPPKDLKFICNAIYKYMNEAFQAKDDESKKEFDYMKDDLKNKSWILCNNTFHPIDEVVFNLPSKFPGNDSLIVEFPIEYTSKYKDLFKFMGVRDEMGARDLISIIKNMVKGNENKVLPISEINNVIIILEQIAKIRRDNRRERSELEELKGLLIPSNNKLLVDLNEILYNDMEDRLPENEKNKYTIAHYSITLDIANELGMQTLKGKIFGSAGDINWEIYEQDESLTTRIRNIIEDYPIDSLFKEFLQNADDAGAKRFLVIVDKRKKFQHDPYRKTFFSEEMEDWQGPSIWIYNDAEFSDEDFQALIKLGVGGKSRDYTKIGKFGIGFNSAFHITDLPSFISGRYIAFLDPHAKFLPRSGFKKPKGTRIDFIEKGFKESFPDQCYPYEAVFNFIKRSFPMSTEGYDFSKEFKGTLFRLPFRTSELANASDISKKVIDISSILQMVNNILDNNEMLFLRNIESCSLYEMTDWDPQLNWEARINMTDSFRNSRQQVIDKAQVYQMDIEIINNTQNEKISEIWAICTGGNYRIKPEFRKFSEEKRLKPRGGVASLLAQSYEESLDELRAGSFPNPPELLGKVYSYLSLPVISNLGVHLNGNFSLSSARSGFLSYTNFLQSSCDDSKWNRYILNDILPDLHTKLLEHIIELENARYRSVGSNFIPHTTNNLWPIPIRQYIATGLYKSYGLNVIRKIGSNNQRIFWTEVNNGRFVSLKEARIFEKEKALIADWLVKSGISAVKLEKDIIKQLDEIIESKNPPHFQYEPVSGKSVCIELQIKRFRMPSFNTSESLFQLLEFILQDKSSYGILTGLPLVPLSDGSVGKFGEVYYIGKEKHLKLFPIAGPSRFVSTNLPEDLSKYFNDDEFSSLAKIKKFDASAILNLLTHELPYVRELEWDPNGESIPNNSWLEKIWKILNKAGENIDFDALSGHPLLPIIEPVKMLTCLDMESPLLYIPENGHTLYPVLVKLEVRFTNMIFPENAHENLKRCIVKCTSINILNSLKKTCSSSYLSMEQLFDKSDLSDSDYEKLRTFIKNEIDTLIEHGQSQEDFMDIIKSLPIWPIHSSEENKFIDATSGKLLTYKLKFFSFYEETDFYKRDSESDFNTLTKLGATPVNELEYIANYIIPQLTSLFPTPSEEYITFLQSVLSLGKQEIEQRLKPYQAIPNKSATTLVKADALYDMSIPIFGIIFDNTDKFLPSELQNNPICLQALGRMGLKRNINCNTYFRCALEIESQISQIQQDRYQETVIRDRATKLVQHLYEHIATLGFNSEQWNKILGIKFVPSEKDSPSQFYENPKGTLGFETFEDLCSHSYKKICWTQCALFDTYVEPTASFKERHPEIGIPSTENIIKHWFAIKEKEKKESWRSSKNYKKEFNNVMVEIYGIMNELSRKESEKTLIKLKIRNPKKKIFLNGDDPFEEKNWQAGSELVFGLQEDIKEGMYKVKDCLMPYEDLLILAGARKEIRPEPIPGPNLDESVGIDPKDLFKSLLNKLIRQSDNDCNDVIFIVGEEKEKISASKYVLSAVSSHFESMFCGGLKESVVNEVEITVKDTRPDIFWVLLRCLYGQSFEKATEDVLRKPDTFTTEDECYETYYLDFLVKLLKLTDYYNVLTLKDKVENIIINGKYISVGNVCEILDWSKESKALRLKSYCKVYIKSNWDLVLEQRIEFCENAENEQERLEETEILNKLLSDGENDNE